MDISTDQRTTKARFTRLRGAAGLSIAWLRHNRLKFTLAIAGIAVAAMLTVTLGSIGYGVLAEGGTAIELINRDLWATAGGVGLRPGGIGGVENPIQNAHTVQQQFETIDGVKDAEALGFNSVYMSDTPSEFETVVGVGVTGSAREANFERGSAFSTTDLHYANGSYDGRMTGEIIIDRQTARRFDVGVGDQLYVGGTIGIAKERSFEVVGITPTFSRFLGVPTVTLHLSELQEVVGRTGTDPAAVIAITVSPGASVDTVKHRLERRFPEFRIRDNSEQVQAIVGRQTALLAAASLLLLLAIAGGILLTANTLALLVQTQRTSIAVALASGMRQSTMAAAVVVEGALLGGLGGALGCLLAVPAVSGVNALVSNITGFDGLFIAPLWLYSLAFGLAVLFGVLGAAASGYLVFRLDPKRVLHSNR